MELEEDVQLQKVWDQADIIETVNKVFNYVDARNWDGIRKYFALEVYFDMSSAGGGEPGFRDVEDIIKSWDEGLKGIEAIHHQVGNHVIELNADMASCFCLGTAHHYIANAPGGEVRTFIGSYDFDLQRSTRGWQIHGFRFTLKFMQGNVELGNGS